MRLPGTGRWRVACAPMAYAVGQNGCGRGRAADARKTSNHRNVRDRTARPTDDNSPRVRKHKHATSGVFERVTEADRACVTVFAGTVDGFSRTTRPVLVRVSATERSQGASVSPARRSSAK